MYNRVGERRGEGGGSLRRVGGLFGSVAKTWQLGSTQAPCICHTQHSSLFLLAGNMNTQMRGLKGLSNAVGAGSAVRKDVAYTCENQAGGYKLPELKTEIILN